MWMCPDTKRWILLNGEIDVDFTNVKNYTAY